MRPCLFDRLGLSMSSHPVARLAAVRSAYARPSKLKSLALALLALAASGCAPHPLPPIAGPDPAAASVKIAPAGYHSSTASYKSMRPAEPTGWVQRNDEVTPPPPTDRGKR